METLYRKVAVSARKPKEGWVLTPSGGILFIDNKWKCPHSGQEQASSLFAHWLEPIKSDNTQTLANTLEQIEKLEAEKVELQQWKDSALEVMNQINLQEVGKVLNLQLGSSVSEQILPSIKKLVADKAELLEALEKIFNISNKPYRNTRNEELEIIDTARNLLNKFQKHKQ